MIENAIKFPRQLDQNYETPQRDPVLDCYLQIEESYGYLRKKYPTDPRILKEQAKNWQLIGLYQQKKFNFDDALLYHARAFERFSYLKNYTAANVSAVSAARIFESQRNNSKAAAWYKRVLDFSLQKPNGLSDQFSEIAFAALSSLHPTVKSTLKQ